MATCPQHGDIQQKVLDNCKSIETLRARLEYIDAQAKTINETIFGYGDGETLKSRIQKLEDDMCSLEERVMENRLIVKEQVSSLNAEFKENVQLLMRGVTKLVIAFISLAVLIIGGMFGLLWSEVKTMQDSQSVYMLSHDAGHHVAPINLHQRK